MNSSAQSLIIMLVLFAVMYLVLIRPQSKKDKQEREMRSNLQVGDEIMTVGGIFGKVVRIREDRITIASGAEKTKLEITKSAVSQKVNKDDKAGKVAEEEKKSGASPKGIKRLGQKKEETAEEVKEAAEAVVETAEEVSAETAEVVATEE